MAAVPRGSSRPAGRILLVAVVAVAHVAAFLAVSLSQPKQTPPPAEPPFRTFPMLPLAPPRSSPRSAHARPTQEKKAALAAEAAPAPPTTSTPGWTLPAPRARAAAAGELADPYAVREALRGSVGCDVEILKLRPDEQARCADRIGRWAQKGRRIGPAQDDPKRAAELAVEEDYLRRKLDWKTSNCGIGNAQDELDEKGTLAQTAPRRGQSKADWAAENKDAC